MHIKDLSKKELERLTPTMKQYIEITKEYEDAIVFYRIGDFYEFFFEYAEKMSKKLELALTGKLGGLDEKIPMAGIPSTYAETYIVKLLNMGKKVALCEQVESFKNGKKEVLGREVVKVITPGTIISSDILDINKSNYIMSIYLGDENYAVAAADLSTGSFFATSFEKSFNKILDELAKFRPSEIIITDNIDEDKLNIIKELFAEIINVKSKDFFEGKSSKDYEYVFSLSFFEKNKEEKNKLEVKDEIKKAVRGIDNYAMITQKQIMNQLNEIEIYFPNKYMGIDYNSRKNLELNERLQDGRKKGSLYWVLDHTKTAMGSREISSWINAPLVNKIEIEGRLDSIEEILSKTKLKIKLEDALKNIQDIERISSKMANNSANAKDMVALKRSIGHLAELKLALFDAESFMLKRFFEELDILDDIYTIIDKTLLDDPAIQITEGGIIKQDFNEELFKLYHIEEINSKKIFELEKEERKKTGISTLRISYHKTFGYHIEVTKLNSKNVPEERYFLKQTLKNQNRYITAELKDLEDEIMGATEKIKALEYEIFLNLRSEVAKALPRIQKAAKIVAKTDAIYSLSEAARINNYTKPKIYNNMQGLINIKNGRHPVVEKISKEAFTPNDTYMDNYKNTVIIITGPNMSGKSTYMRQVALITLMAQIGSFVPAEEAEICIVDKIFTRIGASDDLAMGNSTFMVEMSEVANILQNATNKSLVLLDEVGRGTSTYDGMSIAEAVIEEIADKDKIGAKTLFATHYHELIKLENTIPSIKNYHVTADVIGKDVYFLRKLEKGGSSESYGIHVAKLAGINKNVLKRAEKILGNIEANEIILKKQEKKQKEKDQFAIEDMKYAAIMQKLNKMDINNLTPIEALKELSDLKGMI